MSASCFDLRRARPRGASEADRLRVLVVGLGAIAPGGPTIGALLSRAGGPRLDVASRVGLGAALADLAAHPAAALVLHAADRATARLGLAEVKRAHPALPVVLVTDGETPESAVQAVRAGAEDCLAAAGLTGPHLLRTMLCALERTSHAASLRTQAVTDPLTGLPNRQALQSALEHALARARRHGRTFAVLFADLDGFKAVNDRHGHEHGDRVLQEIAGRFAARTREMDTVARVGGDEFVVVMEDLDDPRFAARLGATLLQAASEPIVIGGQTAVLGVSVGISLYPGDGEDAASLVRHADHAMYAAKAAGTGQVRYYQARMNAHARARTALHVALEHAIGRGELELHYQPVWQASRRRIVAGEARLRWRRPGHGLLAPADFFDTAEQAGLGPRLTAWSLAEAGRHARRLADAGFDVPISINLSRRQLGEPRLAERWREGLAAEGLAPAAVPIECDEALVGGRDPRVAATLADLARLGVPVVVDDVGREASSLQALTHAGARMLKIDATLTQALPDGREAAAMVAALVALARPLGLTVVAEGVENEAQARALGAAGCDHLQGFLYGQPLPADDWIAYLRWACTAVVGTDDAPAHRRRDRGGRRPKARVIDLPHAAARMPGPLTSPTGSRGDVLVGRFRNH
jgi:diguanylate cyclase (GGDEF)-like protein